MYLIFAWRRLIPPFLLLDVAAPNTATGCLRTLLPLVSPPPQASATLGRPRALLEGGELGELRQSSILVAMRLLRHSGRVASHDVC